MIAYAVTPPAVPMMSPDWLLLTVLVETGKLALVAPPGTVTLGGTVAAVVLSLDKATERPPAPAGAVSVTVPVAGSPPTTSVGLTFTVDSAGAASAGAARIPAPMTISTPMTARRDSLRCRVDVVNRLVRMEDLLSVGRPPGCGGSASWYGVVGTYATVRRKGQRSRRSGVLADVWLTTAADDVQVPRTQDASLSLRSCFGGKTAAPPSLSSSMQRGSAAGAAERVARGWSFSVRSRRVWRVRARGRGRARARVRPAVRRSLHAAVCSRRVRRAAWSGSTRRLRVLAPVAAPVPAAGRGGARCRGAGPGGCRGTGG